MSRLWVATICAVSAASLVSCNKPDKPAERPKWLSSGAVLGGPSTRPDAAAQPPGAQSSRARRMLEINDEIIRVEDIINLLRPRLEAAARSTSRDDYYARLVQLVRKQIISEVAERLLWREASRQLNDDQKKRLTEVVDKIERERIDSEFQGREPRYEAALASQGFTREQARERIRRGVLVQEHVHERLLPRVQVTRQELMHYFQTHQAEFNTTRRVEMYLIDLPLAQLVEPQHRGDPAYDQAARRVAREQMEAALKRVRAGEPFEKVARECSKGLNADSGGCWGEISTPLRGYWEMASTKALQMKPGEISDVMENDLSVFFVKVGRVVEAKQPSFEEVQRQVADRLRDQKLIVLEGEYLQSMAERAAVGQLEPFVQAVIEAAPEWQGPPASQPAG